MTSHQQILIHGGISSAASWTSTWEGVVAEHPTQTAVRDSDQAFTYAQIEAWALEIEYLLIAKSVKPGELVAVLARRSTAVIAAMLAISRCGATYVPIDSSYPEERIRFMLDDSAPVVTLTDLSAAWLGSEDFTVLPRYPGGLLSTPTRAQKPATADVYVIYTSGSTGWPKGVGVTPQCVNSMVAWQVSHSVEPNLTTAQFAPLNFDVWFQEVLGTLCGAGTLVIMPEELRTDPFALLRWLEAEKIERIFLPCLALQMLATAVGSIEILSDLELREINVAGEQLVVTPPMRSLFKRIGECRLNNHYGQSESAMVTSYTLPVDVDAWPVLVPIGRPIPGCEVIIAPTDDDDLEREVPTGELLVGGDPLSRGYLRRPEINRQRYVEVDVGGTTRPVFRTGDRVRLLADGNLMFAGRIDSEVKIRGVRIDLSEIEAVLLSQAGVQEAVAVVVETNGSKTLHVGVTLDPELPLFDRAALEHALKTRLPSQSIPASIELIEQVPRSPSGKVDRPRAAVSILTNRQGS